MHSNAVAAFDAPVQADPFASLHHETQSAVSFFWMSRLIRLRREWYRSRAEKEAAERLEQECMAALRHIEGHLGAEYLEWVFRVTKAKQQRENEQREHVSIPRERRR